MRVVLDTNIFISGIFWTGESHKTILAWKAEKFTLVTSLQIISETIRVLSDFKINISEDMIKGWVDLIIRNSIIVEPKEKIKIVQDDQKDDMFVEAAVAGNADYLVSQDNHLLKLKEFREIKIITPEEFNRILNR